MDTFTAAANYPQDLNSLLNTSNMFVQNAGMDQQALAQAQSLQNLWGTGQSIQQAKEKFPLELEEMRARTGLHTSQAGLVDAQASKERDDLWLRKQVPDADRIAGAISKHKVSMTEDQAKMVESNMKALAPFVDEATSFYKNPANAGKVLPVPLQQKYLTAGILHYLDNPTNAATAKLLVNSWLTNTKDYKQAMDVQILANTGHKETANIAAAASRYHSDKTLEAAKQRAELQFGPNSAAIMARLAGSESGQIFLLQNQLLQLTGALDSASEQEKPALVKRYQQVQEQLQAAEQARYVKSTANANVNAQGKAAVSSLEQGKLEGAQGAPAPGIFDPANLGGKKAPEQITLPPEAKAHLKEGVNTTFKNGQIWTIDPATKQPKRVK